MKLYATVASERATKGQGGKWIDIELFGEDNSRLAILKLRKSEQQAEEYELNIEETSMLTLCLEGKELTTETEREVTKGNEQKDEINYCITCNNPIAIGQVSQRHCKNCLRQMGY